MTISELTEVKPFDNEVKEEKQNIPEPVPTPNVQVEPAVLVTLETLKKRIAEKQEERLKNIVAKINMKLPNALTKIAEKEENKVTLWRSWNKKDEIVLLKNQDKLKPMLNLPEGVEIQVKKPKQFGIFANVYAYIR